jgi:hypothetical protein
LDVRHQFGPEHTTSLEVEMWRLWLALDCLDNETAAAGVLIRPSVCPSVRPSVHPSVRLSVRPSVPPSLRLSVRWSVPISIQLLLLAKSCSWFVIQLVP